MSRFADQETTNWADLGQIHGQGGDTDRTSLAPLRRNLAIPGTMWCGLAVADGALKDREGSSFVSTGASSNEEFTV
jgi:hypothetical protein